MTTLTPEVEAERQRLRQAINEYINERLAYWLGYHDATQDNDLTGDVSPRLATLHNLREFVNDLIPEENPKADHSGGVE